ncbi:MAG: cation:proton antiporter [Candidatus Aegiribacteria sp.]|nr:cation:proton antiporter [Candidatus Aegiribacteria sp.]MBD3295410.1 cation:proton antiporter [Candidatus Fermentibacteria bacterium]
MNVPAAVFFGLGIVFNIMGNLGVLIFPDVYTRLQASSTCSTTSVLSFFIGCMFLVGWGAMFGRLLVITLFFFVTSPISAHIIARFAWQNGVVAWRKSNLGKGPEERTHG